MEPKKDNNEQNRKSEGQNNSSTNNFVSRENASKSNAIDIPEITLPKGGGAIKGIEEKFEVNAVNGTGNFSIPIPTTASRQNFQPSLALSYNSGSGNSPYGLGWNLDVPNIQLKTEKKLPRYNNTHETDTYILSGAEDLIPQLYDNGGNWLPIINTETINSITYEVKRYIPRIEGLFARIEQWSNTNNGEVFWKTISKENITSYYGKDTNSRIANPDDASKVFKWLLSYTHDDKGNITVFEYKQEDFVNVPNTIFEKNKIDNSSNAYIKNIRYGNKTPWYSGSALPTNTDFLFSVVFDFGEHDNTGFGLYNQTDSLDERIPSDVHLTPNTWTYRDDAFSNHRAGFDIRTYRLCKRIMLFHHFDELAQNPYLVRSLELHYKNNLDLSNGNQIGGFTYLEKIIQKGHQLNDAGSHYLSQALPPFEFEYQEHIWDRTIRTLPQSSIENLPTGIDNNYQWIDLYGEGISGILTEQANAWFYKENLGGGEFAPIKRVSPKPSLKMGLNLQNLEGDGQKYLVNYQREPKGFYKLDSFKEEWENFQTFENNINIDFNDPNTRFLDVNGDGIADLVITTEHAFCWYPSEGKRGFGKSELASKPFDDEQGPAILFNDPEQTIFIADMTGDGLSDIARIKNGEICYWANLGYGKFGKKTTMANAPVFDFPDHFNPKYLKLADIDGSGTTDIIYLGNGMFKVWMNLNGNSWQQPEEIIHPFPHTNLQTSINIIDLMGNGTACITWSSPLPHDNSESLKYIDLTNGIKPHLMKTFRNNIGKEVKLNYISSTKFYLEDKKAGTPWVTKLPFPVHVVEKTETIDAFSQTRFASQYTYHHGYYDYNEREFRGFGRVDQLDTETFEHFKRTGASNIVQEDLHQPPVLVKKWFHTGAFIEKETILHIFKQEYFQNNDFNTYELPDATIEYPSGLNSGDFSVEEYQEALRACKTMLLREEVYSLDNSPVSHLPYTVSEHNCIIKVVQPKAENEFASFLALEKEVISYQYERASSDPKISHSFNLEYNPYGQAKKAVQVVYPRSTSNPNHPTNLQNEIAALDTFTRNEQEKLHIVYTEGEFTNDIDTTDDYRLQVACESKSAEITGLNPTNDFFSFDEIKTGIQGATEIPYHQTASTGVEKRIIEHARIILADNDGNTALPLGQLASKGFAHQQYQLAFTDALITDLYGTKVDSTKLADAEYSLSDNLKTSGIFPATDDNSQWWIRSGRAILPANPENSFYLPNQYEDPFGNSTQAEFDTNYHLYIPIITDPIGNTIEITQYDYRLMAVKQLKDINDNLTNVAYDILGLPVGTALLGKGNEADNLTGFTPNLTQDQVDAFYNNPETTGANLLQNATGRFVYNYNSQPLWAGSITRENHKIAVDAGVDDKRQYSFEFTSGIGEVLMQKVQAEPGEALFIDGSDQLTTVDTSPNLRWVGTGRTILNNKGNVVKQYEPYFSTTNQYENDSRLVEIGATPIIYYDPISRVIRTEMPDDTFAKVEFTSWKQTDYDPNDTVLDSKWYNDRINNLIDAELIAEGKDPAKEKTAATKTALHANTPNIMHTDSLGRPITSIAHNKDLTGADEFYSSKTILDIEGSIREVIDPRGNTVFAYKYDMLGRLAYQNGMDSGERWIFMDLASKPFYQWDSRNHQTQLFYDNAQRPTQLKVTGGDGTTPMNHITEVYTYGEGLANDKALNLRGQLAIHYDTSGKTTFDSFDFKGGLLQKTNRLVVDYKTIPNWDIATPDSLLETESFTTQMQYDALGRATEITTPDNSLTEPTYNEANLLEQVHITQTGGAKEVFVKNIDYDSKGMRESIIYGNDIKTTYAYDKENFRLIRCISTNASNQKLQDLHYTYDPIGNISETEDQCIPDVFFGGQMVTGAKQYVYDAVYQLIEAQGREHIAQTNFGAEDAWNDLPFLKQYSQSDPMAWRNFTQQYQYDEVGNISQMKHLASGNNWTRDNVYSNTNNRLNSSTVAGQTYNYNHHPQHGYINQLPHLQVMEWNFRDELQAVAKQAVGTGTPETTYYQYNAQGQRTRKVCDYASTSATAIKKDERIYIDGVEIYRKYTNAGVLDLERFTLMVNDDQKRIAMIESRTQGDDGSPTKLVRYQMGDHLDSVSLETDATGNIISYEEYHPFGTTAYQAVDADVKAAAKRYKYTGKERDDESGLYYHGARYYIPWLARWLSPDPIGIADGLNVYAYVSNNPIRMNDPSGTSGEGGEDDPPHTGNLIITFNENIENAVKDNKDNKNWNVYVAKDFEDASEYVQNYSSKKGGLKNLVINTHGLTNEDRTVAGGLQYNEETSIWGKDLETFNTFKNEYESGKYLEYISSEDTDINFTEYILKYSSRLEGNKKKVKALNTLYDIANSINSEGTILFTGCNLGRGEGGKEFAEGFRNILGDSKDFTVYLNQNRSYGTTGFWNTRGAKKVYLRGYLDLPLTANELVDRPHLGWVKAPSKGEIEYLKKIPTLNSTGEPITFDISLNYKLDRKPIIKKHSKAYEDFNK